jgi:tetratricopeptide (TPR) repeat protein
MPESKDKSPAWVEHPLFKEGVARFEAEDWEDALALFSRLSAEFPDDEELKQILADLHLKASLREREGRPRGVAVARVVRMGLAAVGAIALLALLGGISYTVYIRWLVPARTAQYQVSHVRQLHELAKGYITAGDYERAAELYKEILSESPDDETAAAGLERAQKLQDLAAAYENALQLTREEKWFEALWAWRVLAAADPNFRDVRQWLQFVEQQDAVNSLLADAQERYESGDWSGAIQALEQLRAKNADYQRTEVEGLLVSALVKRAREMVGETSDPEAANDQIMQLFDEALNLRPQDADLLMERQAAAAYLESFARFIEEDCQAAIGEIQSAYLQEPPYTAMQVVDLLYGANIHCGDQRAAARDYQAAAACYQAATKLPVGDVSEASDKYASIAPRLTPTPTPRPPAPTATHRPATPTAAPPTATATTSYQYSMLYTEYLPNCGLTFIEGTVWNHDGATQRAGARVKVWTTGWEVTRVTPTDPGKGSGYYDAILSVQGPREGTWYVAVVDANGNPLSETVTATTNTVDCGPNGTGKQWVIIDFRANY